MNNLKLELASIVLSNRNMLSTIEQWARKHLNSISPLFLNTMLIEQMNRIAGDMFTERNYHQVELMYRHLKDNNITGTESPDNYITSTNICTTHDIRAGHNVSIFTIALQTLIENMLCDNHGRLAFQWESLLTTQYILRRVEISQLSAFAMAKRSNTVFGGSYRSNDEELYTWAHDVIIPSVSHGIIEDLGRQGLVEVHRHMNISLQPILIWSELMTQDRIPDRINPNVRQWIRRAQQLRVLLLKQIDMHRYMKRGKINNDQKKEELNLLRLLQLSDSEVDYNTSKFSLRLFDRRAGCSPAEAPFERYFLYELFYRLLETESEVFHAAVHAYCLLQNLVLAELVMPKTSKGLDRFVDLFSSHPLRNALDNEAPHRLVQAYRTGKVFWLEARITPKNAADSIDGLYDSLKKRSSRYGLLNINDQVNPPISNYLRPSHRASLPGVGLIFHFVKKACKNFDDIQVGLHATVRNYQERYEAWQQADAVAEIMNTNAEAATLILGFDVCGSETRTSMDVYASQVRYLNSLGRSVLGSSFLSHTFPEDWYNARITHITCHAGEDFDHLLTGLRHIDEAIRFYALQKGDRIGHGIALGISPDKWSRREGHKRVLCQGEWLDDLVWFHHWLTSTGGYEDVRHQVSEMITTLACKIYQEFSMRHSHSSPIQLKELWSAWQLRSEDPPEQYSEIVQASKIDPFMLGGQGYAQMSRQKHLQNNPLRVRELWWDYLTSPITRREWYKTIEVELSSRWNPAIETIQGALTEKLVQKNIIIEINPSSNLTLGPLDNLTEHPIFRWVDPRVDFTSNNTPMVVVGSDDPSAFATELIHEYALLGRAAEELGATQRQISIWLDHLRQSGIKYSFFPRKSFSADENNIIA